MIQLEGLTIGQLDALSTAIQERRQQLSFANRKRVRDLLIEEARKEGFSISELFGFTTTKPADSKKKARLQSGAYANPANQAQVWTGRGRQPAWFKAAIESGTPAVAMRVDS